MTVERERLTPERWAEVLLDAAPESIAEPVVSVDPIEWPGYAEALRGSADESVVVYRGACDGHPLVLAVFDFRFLGGSLGMNAGRRLREAYDLAGNVRLPLVIVTATGGSRIQEGMAALAQMAGVLAAAEDHSDEGLPQIVIASDPTTGGVFASVVADADIVVAIDDAYIGFAGPRVRVAFDDEGDTETAPSATAERLLRAGQVDAVVSRDDVRSWLTNAVAVLAPDQPEDVRVVAKKPEPFDGTAADAVAAARDDHRPRIDHYLSAIGPTLELSGDHAGGVAHHLRAAIGRIAGRRVMVIGQDHGPVGAAGYRLALRAMRFAERLSIPVLTLIDTQGAASGPEADAEGVARSIGHCIAQGLSLRTNSLAVVIGEGGSGGAMALAAADEVWMQRTATFTVIAPEGAAAILQNHPEVTGKIAEHLKLTASDMLQLGIADRIIPDGVDAVWEGVASWLANPGESGKRRRRRRWRAIADGERRTHPRG